MAGAREWRGLAGAMLGLALLGAPLAAQERAPGAADFPVAQSPILTLDPEQLYQQSLWGQRAMGDWQAANQALTAENDALTARLSAEESELTRLRAELPPEEFQRRAAAFDAQVVEARRAQDQKGREIAARADAERERFFAAIMPSLAEMMQRRGASAILERKSVFVAADALDVTDPLIAAVDAALGDGGEGG